MTLHSRATMTSLALLMGYWGFVDAINAAAAPLLAREFELGDSQIAATFGWVAVGALVALPIARAADRIGRKRVLLLCLLGAAPALLGTSLLPGLLAFVILQIAIQGVKGASMTLVPVMVSEASAFDRRAAGQGAIGAAGAIGGGAALVLVSSVSERPGSWRWAWVVATAGCLLLAWVARRQLAESPRFEHSAARGEAGHSQLRELFAPAYRARTLTILATTAFTLIAVAGSMSWMIYHGVHDLSLSPMRATLVVMIGGSVGMLGFPLGGRLSESWGRRRTFALTGFLFSVAAVAFYRISPESTRSPVASLAVAFAGMSLAGNAAFVPLRAVSTELFPTRLRGAISGLIAIAGAASVVFVNFALSVLSKWLGSLATSVQLVSLAMLAAAALFLMLPETAGLELEQAAGEPEAPR